MKRLVLELDDDFHQDFKTASANQGMSMRQVMTDLLKKWISKNGIKKDAQ